MRYLFTLVYLISFSANAFDESPYGTGFALGSIEDAEVRVGWAKQYPCYEHGFTEGSLEYFKIKVARKIALGPNGKPIDCRKDSAKNVNHKQPLNQR
jgi:hypothetical protein